jgi:hypothetical protein
MRLVRKLGIMLAAAVIVAPSLHAGSLPASISGYVRTSSGPQMGAAVEIVTAGASLFATTVFTDEKGFYSAAQLTPGTYQIKVSAPAFLPSLRENVVLRAGANAVVNLTLSTISEAVQMLPARRAASQGDDDWRWTLRSAANRPILRMRDDGPLVVSSAEGKDRNLKAQIALVAGSQAEGFGSSADMSTAFRVEESLFSSSTLSFNGNVGYSSGSPAGVLRAAYAHQFSNGSRPEFALTLRHFATPDIVQHGAALDALAFSISDGMNLADVVELNYGAEGQAIQFRGRVMAFRPFGSVAVHVTPDTVVQYRYTTSEPNTRMEKGFDSAPADLSESGPRMSLNAEGPVLEHARHHELSVSRRIGNTSLQIAGYSDRLRNAALVGVGGVSDSDMFLPDFYSDTFSYNGGHLATRGVRAVAQHKFDQLVSATIAYGYGGVIDADRNHMDWTNGQSFHVSNRHALTAKLSGDVPRCKTHWIASYKWTSGEALTSVDLFNVSPGQGDPYLNIFLRQPLPLGTFLPGKIEALVDLRNLLAQGYVPVLAPDGQWVYLVQSARSVRGGLAFTF